MEVTRKKWRVIEGYQWGGGGKRMGGKVQGIRSINSRFQNKGEVKNTIGNIEAKELICKTHGHELRWGMLVGGVFRVDGKNGGKWDNCNSTIKKYI